MKNRYEEKLDAYLKEYYLEYEEKSDSVEIHNILMELFKTRCEGKRVALWGAGRKNTENSHAAIILKKYTTYIQGMRCLIDSLPELWGDEFMGYPIISPKEIAENQIDLVIIASKVQADSIVKDLAKYAPGCKYIDIYGELRKRGMVIYQKFYEESNIYTSLYRIRQDYETENPGTEKGKLLKKLISAYLAVRDFYYARKFAADYIAAHYEDWQQVSSFFERLETMEAEIKQLNSRKQEDIVLFFVDSLRAMDVFHRRADGGYEADMLKGYLEEAAVFANAKSTGVTTYESMVSVIQKKYPYEQNVYENNIMAEFSEFSLLPLAKEQGYQIRFYISEGYQVIHDHPDVEFIKQVYLPAKLWKLTTDMACSKEKTFNFIYVPYELHFPLICGFHEKEPRVSGFVDVGVVDTKDFVPRQIQECRDYVDRQFAYYNGWFSRDILFSLFSDHSQVVFDEAEKKPYFMYYNNQDRCVNITFFVKGRHIKPCWREELVSLYDYCDIVGELMKSDTLAIPKREIAVYQYYRIHYKKLREYALEHGMEDYIDGMQCFTNQKYLYMLTAGGKEEVYRLESKAVPISGEEAESFKNKVKAQYNCEFPDFIKD